MKTRERKKQDLSALTDQFKNSTSAMVLSFTKLTVEKDQQFRNELRETGATYQVVKNTLARLAVKDTQFEGVAEHFNGVTSVALTNNEPVDLSKVIAKYVKDYKDVLEFKTGIVEGRTVDLNELNSIASLPSKDELIAKLLFLLNAPAQRLATVLNAVPRDLAIVVKQISERSDGPADVKTEAKEPAPAEEAKEESPEAAADGGAADNAEPQADEAPVEEVKAEAVEESKDDSGEESETPAEDAD